MRKIVFIVVGLIVVLLAAGAISWWRLSAGSGAVSVDTAVREYQQAAEGSVSGPPRPGVYTYALTGKECAGVAGLMLCRSFPTRATVILTREPHSITIELDLSQDHLETSRYTVRSDGLYLAWERTKIVFGIAQDVSATVVPPSLALPATLRVGQRWTEHFNTGGLPVVTLNQVARKATMAIAGTHVTAYEIDASSTTGGAHPGTETDVTWHAPDSGLDVRLIVHRKITGVFPYTMDADATLLSLQPLR